MKIKLVSGLLAVSIACTNTSNVRVNSSPTFSELTAVNMSAYNVQRSPAPTTVSIQNILGSDTARNMGAQSIYMFDPSTRNPVRPYVLGPWNGLCINEPSVNHIAASINQIVRAIQNDEFLRLQTLSATAQRDIGLLQSDFRLMRDGYQAQVNDRDISLREVQRTVDTLRRNNIWTSIGVGVGGVLLGLGVSGLIILTR